VQGASGVDLGQLSPEEREQRAALLQKAKIQSAPRSSAVLAPVDQPPDIKSDDQGSRDSVH
jgi:hypothetical protein